MTERVCRACKQTKLLDEFHRNRRKAGGHAYECKECRSIANQQYRLAHADRLHVYDRVRNKDPKRAQHIKAWQQSERGKTMRKTWARHWAKSNPEKRRAHYLFNYRRQSDPSLQPKPCSICGDSNTQAHHDDYSRPYDVRWFCARHHNEHHRNVKKEIKNAYLESQSTGHMESVA